jgi:hypothetical protein
MNSEIHLFIIWENARFLEEKILEDIKSKFVIMNVYEVEWSKSKFAENLSRFYGLKLPKGSNKERHCGMGPFLLIIIKDVNPIYNNAETSSGFELVNINTFNAKQLYRKWTHGGHKIHSTNSLMESKHDIVLLIGQTVEEFEKQNKKVWDGNVNKLNKDLIGAIEWTSLRQVFTVLNNCCNYLVLRNYNYLPDVYKTDEHGDIDLLTDNLKNIVFTLNAHKVYKYKYRVHYYVIINNEKVFFDFRYIGDNYYTTIWEENMLLNRVFNSKGFYVQNNENYLYSLVYHMLVHKNQISDDYNNKFNELVQLNNLPDEFYNIKENQLIAINYLKKFLLYNNYSFSDHYDLSVYLNPNIVSEKVFSLRRKIYYIVLFIYRGTIKKLKKRV